MRLPSRVVLSVSLLALSCGPSKAEREAAQKRAAEEEQQRAKAAAAEAQVVVDLGKLADQVRATCAAEFARVGAENLGPGEAAPCELPAKPVFKTRVAVMRSTPADVAEAYKAECETLQKELDLAVTRAGPGNPSSFRTHDAKVALETFQSTVLVGLLYEKRVFPELVKDPLGKPLSFKPGVFEGSAYLYSLGSGKLACVSKVMARSSDKIQTLKVDEKSVLGPEGTAAGDIDAALGTQIEKALEAAPRLALAPLPKKEPPPPVKKGKKAAPPKKTKRR